MSGPPFQIASMDENGILNMWVSNICMKREYRVGITKYFKYSNPNLGFLMSISSLKITATLAILLESSSNFFLPDSLML